MLYITMFAVIVQHYLRLNAANVHYDIRISLNLRQVASEPSAPSHYGRTQDHTGNLRITDRL